METLTIDRLGSMKFTSQNDLYQEFQSEHEAILIETKF